MPRSIGIKSVSNSKTRVRPRTHILTSYSRKDSDTKLSKKDLSLRTEPFEGCHLNNKKEIVHLLNREVRKKSIAKYREDFNSTFEENLATSEMLSKQR